MPRPIELRSDTFTQPTDAMRQAIANAIVGDDMVGEDPTVNELERRMCQLLGKPAAVYACSGSQSNQIAIWSHCRPGDELLIESTGHIANWEGGAPAVCSGVSIRRVPGEGGMLTPADLTPVLRPRNQHAAQQTLLCLENTTNLGGGRVWPFEQFQEVCAWARPHGLKIHLDGARLFNAVIASGISADRWASEVDSVSICFSKGLGCPMGSVLVGNEQVIADARRARKIFGGALRQSGMMAAAAVHAIDLTSIVLPTTTRTRDGSLKDSSTSLIYQFPKTKWRPTWSSFKSTKHGGLQAISLNDWHRQQSTKTPSAHSRYAPCSILMLRVSTLSERSKFSPKLPAARIADRNAIQTQS